jgi:hypothetical protein
MEIGSSGRSKVYCDSIRSKSKSKSKEKIKKTNITTTSDIFKKKSPGKLTKTNLTNYSNISSLSKKSKTKKKPKKENSEVSKFNETDYMRIQPLMSLNSLDFTPKEIELLSPITTTQSHLNCISI